MTQRLTVAVVGIVPFGPSGVRDYGDLLNEEFRRREVDSGVLWFNTDGVGVRVTISASLKLLRSAWSFAPGTVVLWQYSPFAYALHGVPLPGVLFSLLLRARGVSVVTVLHELAYPWGRRGVTGRVFSLTQNAALVVIVAGSTMVVVTTEHRARALRRGWWRASPPCVSVLPVFSTIVAKGITGSAERGSKPCVGVIGYGSDGTQGELLIAALRHLIPRSDLRVLLMGAPGAHSDAGRRWTTLARAAGMQHRFEFTGVLPLTDLSSRIDACDVILLLDEEGPSSRRTMLAAALAHGKPTISTDGPNRWEDPIAKGVIAVVPPDAEILGQTLERLLNDPEERAAMGRRAQNYYSQEMSLERAAQSILGLIGMIGK